MEKFHRIVINIYTNFYIVPLKPYLFNFILKNNKKRLFFKNVLISFGL